MQKKLLFTLGLCLVFAATAFAQGSALTFQEAEKAGIPFQHLDSLYKSAIHTNPKLAVFKTAAEQEKLMQAYTKLLQDLGAYLRENNYSWETQTRGMNRIYLSPDGRIDYFLFHFPEGQLTAEKEQQFAQHLNSFVQNYRFAITAPEKFAQCSAVKYSDR